MSWGLKVFGTRNEVIEAVEAQSEISGAVKEAIKETVLNIGNLLEPPGAISGVALEGYGHCRGNANIYLKIDPVLLYIPKQPNAEPAGAQTQTSPSLPASGQTTNQSEAPQTGTGGTLAT